jgi:uncharacterized DUF497 family protein
MEFEWDENKNVSNISKHGISFELAALVFYQKHVMLPSSNQTSEHRFIAISKLKVKKYNKYVLIAVIYTYRDQKIRIISARKAKSKEEKKFNSIYD